MIESSENAIKSEGESFSVERVAAVDLTKTNSISSASTSAPSPIAIMPITNHHLPSSTPTTHQNAPTTKKRKNSFFSRLSSFRFSLKNSKKEPQQQHPEKNGQPTAITPVVAIAHHHHPPSKTTTSTPMSKAQSPPAGANTLPTSGKRGTHHNQHTNHNNFVHIPLKDPVDQLDHFSKQKMAIQRQQQQLLLMQEEERRHTSHNINMPVHKQMQPPATTTGSRFVNNQNNGGGLRMGGMIPMDTSSSLSSSSTSSPERVVLHKKPPLPKHPPRVIGVCAKRCADANAQRGAIAPAAGEERDTNNNRSVHHQSASSGGGAGAVVIARGEEEDSYRCFSTHNPRAATMQRCTGPGGSKIGLIETNLDTHETIISGKTRSLMELHPQHGQHRSRYSQQMMPPHQRIPGAVDCGGRQSLGAADGGCGGGSSISNGPAADAIRQRPHKSMEFLLDKENQLYTLVSGRAIREVGRGLQK